MSSMNAGNPGTNRDASVKKRYSLSRGLLDDLVTDERLYVDIDVNDGKIELTRGDLDRQRRVLNDKLDQPVHTDSVVQAFARPTRGFVALSIYSIMSYIGLTRTDGRLALHIIEQVNSYMLKHGSKATLYKLDGVFDDTYPDKKKRKLAAKLNGKDLESKTKLGKSASKIRLLVYRVP